MDSFEESMSVLFEKFKTEYEVILKKESDRLKAAGLSNEEIISIVKAKTSKFKKEG